MGFILESPEYKAARIKAKRERLKAEGCDIAWVYTNVQSGYVTHSPVEPEREDYEMFHIREITLDEVPDHLIESFC